MREGTEAADITSLVVVRVLSPLGPGMAFPGVQTLKLRSEDEWAWVGEAFWTDRSTYGKS